MCLYPNRRWYVFLFKKQGNKIVRFCYGISESKLYMEIFMLTKYRMLMTIAVIFTLSIVGFDNVFASDYMENKEKLEQEGNKVLIKKMENIYLKMLWGTEIARDEFNDVEKKPFNDINGTTLDEIENGKLELRELPSQSAIFRIMSNDIILKNRNMFVDDEIKKLNFNEKYICLSGVQTEEGTTTYTDPECRHRKEQAYINCGNRGDEACVRSIAMQGLHYYDECKKQRTVMYEKC